MATQQSTSELLTTLARWGEKGTLKKSTSSNLRAACDRVFTILETPEREDVAKIDVNDALQRFHNLNPSVSYESLRGYKSRVLKAIKLFLDFKKDPINWKPEMQTRPSRSTKSKTQATNHDAPTTHDDDSPQSETPRETQPPYRASSVSTLTIPFPLRADVTINIAGIPRDLTSAECERIAAFLRPLATDFGQKAG